MPPLTNTGYLGREARMKRGGVAEPKRDKWMNLGMSGLADQMDITKAADGLEVDGPGNDPYGFGIGDSELGGMMTSTPSGTAPMGTTTNMPSSSPRVRGATQAATDLERGSNQAGQKVSPNPSIWRSLLGAGAEFVIGRRSPAAGQAISDALTNSDPSVKRYKQTLQQYQLKKPLEVEERQWEDERRKQALLQQRINQLGQDATHKRATEQQAGVNAARTGGFVSDAELQTPGSPGTPWPAMGGAVNPQSVDEVLGGVPPGAQGPSASPSMAGQAGPTSAALPGMGNAGATTPGHVQPPPGFRTTVPGIGSGTMPSPDYLEAKKRQADVAANIHKVTADEAEALNDSGLTGKEYSKEAWSNIAKQLGPEKPEKTGNDFEQFYKLWLSDNKLSDSAANRLKARKAYKEAEATPERAPHTMVMDPATNRMVELRPGSVVPKGAQTIQGVNTANTATSQTRGMSEMAETVTKMVPVVVGQIDALKDKIGPGAGRWNELWVNRGGMDDPDFAGLDQDLDLFASALVRTHFGARGGQGYREALKKNFSAAQSPEDLKARIEHADKWIQGYAQAGKSKQTQDSAPSGAGQPTPPGSAIDPQIKAYADSYFGGDVAKAQAAIAAQRSK